jgi:hypothetical protein
MLSFLADSNAFLNTVKYEDNEYSYISEIADRPYIAKKRIAPRFATSLYDSLLYSISASVILAFSSARDISIALDFAFSNVSIKGTLSTKGISVSFDNSLSKVSSRSFRVALLREVSMTNYLRCLSNSGLSKPTTSFSS